MKRYLLVCLLALAAVWAQAGVGLTTLPGLHGDGPVTVFYPADCRTWLADVAGAAARNLSGILRQHLLP